MEEQLRAIERRRLQALISRDFDVALRLHSPDFQLITPSGAALTRAQYFGKIESGDIRYLLWAPGPIAVRLMDRSAVLRYQATLELDSGNGSGTPFQCWHMDSYELSDAGWQVVWSQATAIKEPMTPRTDSSR